MKQYKFRLDDGTANHPFSDGHSYVFNLNLQMSGSIGITLRLDFDSENSPLNPACGVIVHPLRKTATLAIQPQGTTMPVQFSRNFKNWDGNLVIRMVKSSNSPTISRAYCNGELISDSSDYLFATTQVVAVKGWAEYPKYPGPPLSSYPETTLTVFDQAEEDLAAMFERMLLVNPLTNLEDLDKGKKLGDRKRAAEEHEVKLLPQGDGSDGGGEGTNNVWLKPNVLQFKGKVPSVPISLAAIDITTEVTKSKPEPFERLYFNIYRGVWWLKLKPSSTKVQHVVAIKALRTGFDPDSKSQERQDFEVVCKF